MIMGVRDPVEIIKLDLPGRGFFFVVFVVASSPQPFFH